MKKNIAFIILTLSACVALALAGSPSRRTSAEAEKKIDALIQQMTPEEKIGQLIQYSGNWTDSMSNSTVPSGIVERIKEGKIGSLLNVYGSTITREMQALAVEQTRLKIPLLFGFDVIHGFRTTFPIPLAQASSWDANVVEQSARMGAEEAASAGIHWTFAPMVDIARDPRWGRIAEGSGEDPFLGSALATAYVRGFQGGDLARSNTIIACAKHFAAYGGAEGGRDYNTVDISERTLRETYLPPFKAALDAGVETFMSSFNEIAGVPSTGNHALLTGILRNEWSFDGFVVSDWNSVGELHTQGIATTRQEAGVLAITAGTDMDMESDVYRAELPSLLKSGQLPDSIVNEAVKRVLRSKVRLGLFDDPYRYCNAEVEKATLLSKKFRDAARDIARKSIVLLKNDANTLPLRKDTKTLAVIGPLADDHENPLGPWEQIGQPENVVSALDGIKSAVSSHTKVLYAKGCEIDDGSAMGFAAAVNAAKSADAVVLVLGESSAMSGEAASRASLDLPGKQDELLKAIHAAGKPVVVVLMNGRPLTINWAAQNVPAIVESWFLGLQTGNAIADVLFGDYNPSGKLPVTFPRAVGQIPVHYNYKNTGRPTDETAKFTSRYIDQTKTPLYPFGFGLSYSTFLYSDLNVSSPKINATDNLKVSVAVKNTSLRAGEEVVQLYIRDEYGSVTRPVKELKGFRKITLAPGEMKLVEFVLTPAELACYDRAMKFVVEPGTFKVFVGTNSANTLDGSFEVIQHAKPQ